MSHAPPDSRQPADKVWRHLQPPCDKRQPPLPRSGRRRWTFFFNFLKRRDEKLLILVLCGGGKQARPSGDSPPSHLCKSTAKLWRPPQSRRHLSSSISSPHLHRSFRPLPVFGWGATELSPRLGASFLRVPIIVAAAARSEVRMQRGDKFLQPSLPRFIRDVAEAGAEAFRRSV